MINSALAHSLVDKLRGKEIRPSDVIELLVDYEHKNEEATLVELCKIQQETIFLSSESIDELLKMNKMLKEINEIQADTIKSTDTLSLLRVKTIKADMVLYNLKGGLYRLFNKIEVKKEK